MQTLKDKIILALTQEEARKLVLAVESFTRNRSSEMLPQTFEELYATLRKELLNG